MLSNVRIKACLVEAAGKDSVIIHLGDTVTCSDLCSTDTLNAHFAQYPQANGPMLGRLLFDLACQVRSDRLAMTAFPAEAAQEAESHPFDQLHGPEDAAKVDQQDAADAEQDMLDQTPLPDTLENEG